MYKKMKSVVSPGLSFSANYSIKHTNLPALFFHLMYVGNIPNHPKQSHLTLFNDHKALFYQDLFTTNDILVVPSFFLLPIEL